MLEQTWRSGSDPKSSGALAGLVWSDHKVSLFVFRRGILARVGRYQIKLRQDDEQNTQYLRVRSTLQWRTIAGRPHLVVTIHSERTDPTDGSMAKSVDLKVTKLSAACVAQPVAGEALKTLRTQPGGRALPAAPRAR